MPPDIHLSWEDAVAELKRRPEAADLVKACFYDDPLVDAADRYWQSTEWHAVRAFLPSSPGAALDIGAGRGIAAYALARDGWHVTALEPDPSSSVGAGAIRSLARDCSMDIQVVQTWGEELPFPDAAFDVVHCRQVLHHARDLSLLCRQIGRVLKPGGRLIATREHVITRKQDLPAFLDNHPLHNLYGGENAYQLRDYVDAIGAAGIRLDRKLNPMASDINLFPFSQVEVRERWAKRLKLPSARWIPKLALALVGARSDAPGRLYTFVGTRVSSHG